MGKRKIWPIFAFCSIVLIIAFIFIISNRFTPSKERYSLNKFFGNDSDSKLALMVDDILLENSAVYVDDSIYVSYDVVHDYICERFYWDEEQNAVFFVNPDGIEIKKNGEGVYINEGTVYLSWDLISKYAPINYSICKSPNRIVIDTIGGKNKYAKVKKDSEIRYRGGIKSPILRDVKVGETLRVLDIEDGWIHVVSEDGCIGYIQSKHLDDFYDNIVVLNNSDKAYKTLSIGKKVCMVWHQMTSRSGNNTLLSKLEKVKGVNVISPTWFFLEGNDGTVNSIADKDYVNTCHSMGISVWALVDNFTNDVNTYEALKGYSTRKKIVSSLIDQCKSFQIDGINVDFEGLEAKEGPGFIEFIRELSIECHKNNLILSVDNHVPYNFNSFYAREEQSVFADYMIVMSYDEHINLKTGEGSVSSLEYVKYSVSEMLKVVPKDKLINAIPFYTRIWKETPKTQEEIAAEKATEDYTSYNLSWETANLGEAALFINDNSIQMTWDDNLGQEYGQIDKDGGTYKIWNENSRSLKEKLNVAKQNDIAGIAAWKLGFETDDIWDLIEQYYPEKQKN